MLLIALLTQRPGLLTLLLELMETHDWDVCYCPHPLAALAQWQSEPPNLVIMDDGLPGSEQRERFLRRLQSDAQTRDIPVIMVFDSADDAAASHQPLPPGVKDARDVLDWDRLVETIENLVSVAPTKDDSRISLSRR